MAQQRTPRKKAAPRKARAKKPTLKPFKFIVQPVVLEVDGTGKVLGERPAEPITLYGVESLRAFADSFEQKLADAVVDGP